MTVGFTRASESVQEEFGSVEVCVVMSTSDQRPTAFPIDLKVTTTDETAGKSFAIARINVSMYIFYCSRWYGLYST